MNLEPQKKVLLNLKDLIEKLDPQSFTQKNKTLFGASIGGILDTLSSFTRAALVLPLMQK
jgi:hypothetical protein